jgi:hypothetical protein
MVPITGSGDFQRLTKPLFYLRGKSAPAAEHLAQMRRMQTNASGEVINRHHLSRNLGA